MVADALSRIPGSEFLTSFKCCSSLYILGIQHVDDVAAKLTHQQAHDPKICKLLVCFVLSCSFLMAIYLLVNVKLSDSTC